MEEQKPHEFTGQLYTAHQLITAAETNKDFSPALAVTQAYENVRQMVRGLSELNQNIRHYVERATREKDVPERGSDERASDVLASREVQALDGHSRGVQVLGSLLFEEKGLDLVRGGRRIGMMG